MTPDGRSDLGLVVIRVLAGLHGLPALAGVLGGAFLLVGDLLDGHSGVWDGFGVAVGGFVLVLGSAPLVLAVAAVRSRNPFVVRGCGLALSGLGLACLTWLERTEPLFLLPSAALGALSLLSWLTSDAPYDEASGPIRLPGGR